MKTIERQVAMLDKPIDFADMWLTVQEPRLASFVPNSYLLLLSALENGWQIGQAEMRPSWDQHGFIYLVSLYLHTPDHRQKLILPKNALVDSFLDENLSDPSYRWSMTHPVAG